jgi:hypothetical protein
VGLFVYAPGLKAILPPDGGPAHGNKIAHALATACGTHDAHRSGLDEPDVAVRVLEHLRPLDPRGLADVRRGDLDKLSSRAEAMRARAPFAAAAPFARSPRERTLRRYLASFGIDAPPKTESDPRETEEALCDALAHIAKVKPRPSLVHVVAPPPPESALPRLADAVRRVTRTGAMVSWSAPSLAPALAPPWDDPQKEPPDDEAPLLPPRERPAFTEIAPIAAEAVLARARVAEARREAGLRRIGVRVVRVKHVLPAREGEAGEPASSPAA